MNILMIILAKAVKLVALVLSYVSSMASIFWEHHEPKMPQSMIQKQMEK